MANRHLDHISRRVLLEFDPFIYERPTGPMPDPFATSTALRYLEDIDLIAASDSGFELTPKGRQQIADLKRSRIDRRWSR